MIAFYCERKLTFIRFSEGPVISRIQFEHDVEKIGRDKIGFDGYLQAIILKWLYNPFLGGF